MATAAPSARPGQPAAPAAADRGWTAIGPVDAPAIVFLHGTRLSRRQWWPQLRRLSPSYRCVALDLPAHGALAGRRFTLEAAADVVAGVIDAAVPSGRAVIVGLSLGGYTAIVTAERHPDRVAGLVLAGCSADPVGPTALPFRALELILRRAPASWVDAVNRGYFRLRYRPGIAEPVIAGGFWPQGGAQALRALLRERFLERLSRLWTPVLVLNGTLDPLFGPTGDAWAAACRRGRHETLPRASHVSNLDQPTAFARAVRRFVDEVSTGI